MADNSQQHNRPGSIVARFRAGQVLLAGRLAAARGAMPLPPEELLVVLFVLRKDPEQEVRTAVIETVREMPAATLRTLFHEHKVHPAIVDFYARVCQSRSDVLEIVLTSPSAHDKTVEYLAERAPPEAQSMIVVNQIRMERHPAIAEALRRNPSLDPAVHRRLDELAKLHRARPARAPAAPKARAPEAAPAAAPTPPAVPEPPAPPVQEAAPPAKEAPAPTPGPEGQEAEDGPDEEVYEALDALEADVLEDGGAAELEEAIDEELGAGNDPLANISQMSVPEKVELARFSDRRTRGVLIRDGARKVQDAVLASPRLSSLEIEAFAAQRSLSEDVLRQIATNREWTKNRSIVKALLFNPKTPVGVSLRFLPRQTTSFLQELVKNKNVPGALRAIANKLFQDRTTPTDIFKGKKH